MNYQIFNIKTIPTISEGNLSFFEGLKDIPFEIKRIYYISDVPVLTKRGGHAHKKLQQFLFCPHGIVKVILDDGEQKQEIILDKPSIGLVLYPCLWRDIVFLKPDTVLCVAVSEYYNEQDYIRDYETFIDYRKKGENKK